ncbi:MAG: hypothetical protein EHM48_00715 [Planctomycetaceae bacterium]|nr:MAG: hypothetical protein EHM48_00715 [Planctomycetaceae bacterium]
MTMYDVAEIKDRIDIVALIGETVNLKHAGTSLQGLCPFHSNTHTPALAVFPKTKTWKCFGACGDGGDVFAWWMKRENCDFPAAVKALAERSGAQPVSQARAAVEQPKPPTPLPSGPNDTWIQRAESFITYTERCLASPDGERARAYLEQERGLWPEAWQDFRLGYNPTNILDACESWGLNDDKKVWLPRGMVIPGMWRGGLPWYVKIRRPLPKSSLAPYIGPLTPAECITDFGRLDPNDDPKFGGPRGGHSSILFTHRMTAKSNLPVLLLTEGEWDAMLAWQWGRDLCDVGTLGGVTARADAMRLAQLARYAAVGVVMDSDEAGQENVKKYWAKMAEETGRVHVIPPPDHDLTDYWKATAALRPWIAGVVADLLDNVLDGLKEAPQAWVNIRDWARSEQYAS